MGRTMFDVRSSIVRRQKLGVRVRLLTDEHVQCSFDVRSTVRRTFNEHQKQKICQSFSLTLVTKLTASVNVTLIFIKINHFQNSWM